jgi:hypothetical protein
MSGHKRLPAAVLAGGVLALVALVGCEREPSVPSKNEGAEPSHGHGAHDHGAAAQGGGHSGEQATPGAAGHAHHPAPTPGHDHDHGSRGASPDHSTMGHGSEAHAGAQAPRHAGSVAQGGGHGHGGHAGMDHGPGHAAPRGITPGQARTGGTAGQDEHPGHDEHAGHAVTSPETPRAGATAPAGDHAGYSPVQGTMAPATAAAAPVAVAPGQPAATLRPGPLDAPAATSVRDAQRSAEIAEEMTGGRHGGHGGHGTGTYTHVDVGRGPGAYEGAEDQTPGAEVEPHHHDHGAATAPSGQAGEPAGHEHPGGAVKDAAAVYVCPMHPEVTSATPGTCPKCGMDLVERRKE